jgi:gluconokinase
MSAGTPLDDDDRAPWLDLVGERLRDADGPILVGCSALKRSYRDRITAAAGGSVTFLHLSGTRQVIEARMSAREGHFMPVALLDSQFATLEPLQDGERSVIVDIDQTLAAVVTECTRGLTA